MEILLLTHKNCPSYLTDFSNIDLWHQRKNHKSTQIQTAHPACVGVDAAENWFVESNSLWNNLPEKLCSNSNINSFNQLSKPYILYKQAI
jgi:hypothetical protein